MTLPAMPFGQPHPEHVRRAGQRETAIPSPARRRLADRRARRGPGGRDRLVDRRRPLDLRPPGADPPFLIPAALLGTAYGIVAAKAGWSRWLAMPLGALAAGLVLPVMIGGVLVPGADPAAQFGATANAIAEAYLDVAWRGRVTTVQFAQWLLVFGVLGWGTGWFIAWTTFRHRRPINAVMLAGAALVASMSLTINDQFGALVTFSIAALLLLIRMHAFEERSTWLRHQVWRAGTMGAPYLRGGLIFVAVAVGGGRRPDGHRVVGPASGRLLQRQRPAHRLRAAVPGDPAAGGAGLADHRLELRALADDHGHLGHR